MATHRPGPTGAAARWTRRRSYAGSAPPPGRSPARPGPWTASTSGSTPTWSGPTSSPTSSPAAPPTSACSDRRACSRPMAAPRTKRRSARSTRASWRRRRARSRSAPSTPSPSRGGRHLGLRMLQVDTARHAQFEEQIRALLASATAGRLRILLPFVTDVDDLRFARAAIAGAAEALRRGGVEVPRGARRPARAERRARRDHRLAGP